MTMRKHHLALLAAASGILMGIAFPPFTFGSVAWFAWIPLFFLAEELRADRSFLRWIYFSMFVFNAITLYWTGGFIHGKDLYMMLAGTMLLVGHPLLFSVPFLGWRFLRRRVGVAGSWAAFPFLWVTLEYLHSINQFSFPWLLFGNTQTNDLTMIQIASATGVYGISFIVAASNVVGYLLLSGILRKERRVLALPSVALAATLVCLWAVPRFVGARILATRTATNSSREVRVGVVQPNIDPFEKWSGHEESQMEGLLRLTGFIADNGVDLVLWPETATPFYLLHPSSSMWLSRVREVVDRRSINLLSGVPDIVYYPSDAEAPRGSKISENGHRYDSYNSSMLLQPRQAEIQKYAKIVLVPFAEHVPYSESLNFLNAAQWNFGLGGWSIGRDTTVFQFQARSGPARCANFICYESVFPGFVAGFVRKGAEFLTVVTNDSWWGNTSGAYQHERFAVLRAVENRRWVVQCANGGISCVIDPEGRVKDSLGMYRAGAFVARVQLNDEITFYTEHGDWFARLCVAIAGGTLALALLGSALGHKRSTQ